MTDEIQKPLSAETLTASMAKVNTKGRKPPVHLWNPPFCGDIDMRIARDGTWFYLGTPIGRHALVKLFSSILKKEDDKYFLVTPVEKVGIRVDDAPFVAVDFEVTAHEGHQVLTFTTQVDDHVIACDTHKIRVVFDKNTGEPTPYIHVRDGLDALIDRKSFYRLIDIATTEPYEADDWLGLRSMGVFFPIIRAAELPH